MVEGFKSLTYAQSFSEQGEVLTLPHSGTHVLKRQIDNNSFDVAGLFPYVHITDAEIFRLDIEFLKDVGAVSFVMISDPFIEYRCMNDLKMVFECKPFKHHYLIDLSLDWYSNLKKELRKYIRRGARLQRFHIRAPQADTIETFWPIYKAFTGSRSVASSHLFSRKILEQQLETPGVLVATTEDEQGILAQAMIVVQDGFVHCHLIGMTKRAYSMYSSYVIIHGILEHAQKLGCRFVNLGGYVYSNDDGISTYKRRFSTEERMVYLCCKVLDDERYNAHTVKTGTQNSAFFPAYRSCES